MAYTFCATNDVCLDGSQIIAGITPPYPQCCTQDSPATTTATYCSGVDTCSSSGNPENNCGVNTPVSCAACTTCDAGTQGHTCTGNPTGSQYYCGSGTCKQCPAGQTWTGTVCASPQCGAPGTDGLNCPAQAPLPTVNNYYCGDSSGNVANPGICCPATTQPVLSGGIWTCQARDPCPSLYATANPPPAGFVCPGQPVTGPAACCPDPGIYGDPNWQCFDAITVY
jgi:hypothetical protein